MANVKKFVYISSAAKWTENVANITAETGKWYKSIVFRADTNEIYNRGKAYGVSAADGQRITNLETAVAALQKAQLSVVTTDKVLTIVEGTGEDAGKRSIQTTLGINYDSTTKKVQLLGKENSVISEFDAKAFIKDGMLESAELVTVAEEGITIEVPYIKLTFNTFDGTATHDVIRFSVKSLVDLYDAANINLTEAYSVPTTYTAGNIAAGKSMNVVVGELVAAHNSTEARVDEVEEVTAASLNDLNARLMNETDWEEL